MTLICVVPSPMGMWGAIGRPQDSGQIVSIHTTLQNKEHVIEILHRESQAQFPWPLEDPYLKAVGLLQV